jgi:hypothetical protein
MTHPTTHGDDAPPGTDHRVRLLPAGTERVTGLSVDAVASRIGSAGGWPAAVHHSRAWAGARRYLPVYRWAAGLDDRTIAATVAAGWGAWLLGGLLAHLLGGPGAVVPGVVLAVVLAVVDVAVVSWWMGYRRSPARLRHAILAREQIAAGRELADSSLGGRQVAGAGAQVRPSLAAGQLDSGPTRRRVTAIGPEGRHRACHPGTLPTCAFTHSDLNAGAPR